MTRVEKAIGGVCLAWHAAALLLVNLATVWPEQPWLAEACNRWPFRQWVALTGTAGGYGFFAPGVSSPFRLVCGDTTVIGPTGIREAALLDSFQDLLPTGGDPDTIACGGCSVQVLYLPPLRAKDRAPRWLNVHCF